VAPPLPRPGHGLLRCPVCRLDLIAGGSGRLACRNRHSFDLARDGYVNLLRGRRPAEAGDNSAQLRHRARFLDASHFRALAPAIADRLAAQAGSTWRVLDAGCGTGHHLAAVAAELRTTIGLGLDVAREAARFAARRWPGLGFAVGDLWADWPVRDGAADLVLSIFAPKNFIESARVLQPGGWLAVVYPGAGHLIELRRRFGLMGQSERKTSRYAEAAERHVGPAVVTTLASHVLLDAVGIRDAVLMGPNARATSTPRQSTRTSRRGLPSISRFCLPARRGRRASWRLPASPVRCAGWWPAVEAPEPRWP
jgi:23S rRNA (guanine745-N1)-methyltransferase